MTDSQDWWPADWGHYGGLMIRMAWHAAGSYRLGDGRGGAGTGNQRFAPLNSWPDNASLDKARRLLWPDQEEIRQCAQLGGPDRARRQRSPTNHGPEDLRLRVRAGGHLGTRDRHQLGQRQRNGSPRPRQRVDSVETPTRCTTRSRPSHMGLIYVNPEGVNGSPDPAETAKFVRTTFARMAMNDEETARSPSAATRWASAMAMASPRCRCRAGSGDVEAAGLGWAIRASTETPIPSTPPAWRARGRPTPPSGTTAISNSCSSTTGSHEIPRRVHGSGNPWTSRRGHGARRDRSVDQAQPDHDGRRHGDEGRSRPTARSASASTRIRTIWPTPFARAWFKLTHRDMGPKANTTGLSCRPKTSSGRIPWPPVPEITTWKRSRRSIAASGLSSPDLVATAWDSARTFRSSDKRGGANGARIRLAPAKATGSATNPSAWQRVLAVLEPIAAEAGPRSRT